MNPIDRELHEKKGGFTLIEIAMAIVVVAIGVLAVFSLLSAGLDASSRAIADTQGAMFADNVFNALRAESLSSAKDYNPFPPAVTNGWNDFWLAFTGGSDTNITVAAGPAWVLGPGYVQPIKPGSVETLVFKNKTLRGSTINDVQNYALRYRLTVQPASGGWTPTVWTNTAKVTLEVWAGQYGSTANPLVFYSEFYNPGGL